MGKLHKPQIPFHYVCFVFTDTDFITIPFGYVCLAATEAEAITIAFDSVHLGVTGWAHRSH